MTPSCGATRPHFKKSQPLRDGYRDFIAVIASLGETRLRDITQSECHWALASGLGTQPEANAFRLIQQIPVFVFDKALGYKLKLRRIEQSPSGVFRLYSPCSRQTLSRFGTGGHLALDVAHELIRLDGKVV